MACGKCQKKFHIRIILWLDSIINKTNWRATTYQSYLQKKYLWVGKGFNPDYTTVCTKGGSGTCQTGTCVAPEGGDCIPDSSGCSCSCPSPPIANSHYVSDTCVKGYTGCQCYYQGGAFRCSAIVCACSGACAYSCDTGYSWNGSACVATGTNMQINIGDTWKTVSGVKINIGDTWKTVTKIQINIGDIWKNIFG